MSTVVVWGELLWDRFPDGDQLGGAPTNVAWHLAQLGTAVALATRVGDDAAGHEAIARLAGRGVDTSLIQVDPERATGEVTVTLEDGEPRYRLVPGCAWERIELTAAIGDALTAARALVFGTLAQREPAGLAGLAAALATASPRVLRVCDPNLRPRSPSPGDDEALRQALAAADVCKVGEREVAAIQARLGVDPVASLLARGARLVAVTRGPDGSTFYAPGPVDGPDAEETKTDPARHQSPRTPRVIVDRSLRSQAPGLTLDVASVPARPGGDNVGCGDAYVAGLVHGLLAGWPWPRIGRLAAAIAAEVAGARGATPIVDGARLIAEAT